MKNINTKNKIYLLTCLLFLIISLSYVILYEILLENIIDTNFNLLYRHIFIVLARPVFYMMLSAILGKLLLIFSDITIQNRFRKYSFYLLMILILVNFILIFVHFFVGLPFLLFQLSLNSPVLYILLGVLLSISVSDKQKGIEK